jgi:hypothetical protein
MTAPAVASPEGWQVSVVGKMGGGGRWVDSGAVVVRAFVVDRVVVAGGVVTMGGIRGVGRC